MRAASSTPRPNNNNDTLALSRPQRARRPPPRDYLSDDPSPASKRRKETGGLRLSRPSLHPPNANESDNAGEPRQIEPGTRKFPQRKKVAPKVRPMQPSTLDRLIIGIWEQIHGSISFDPQIVVRLLCSPRRWLVKHAASFVLNGRCCCSSRAWFPSWQCWIVSLIESRLTSGRSHEQHRRALIAPARHRKWYSLLQEPKNRHSTR